MVAGRRASRRAAQTGRGQCVSYVPPLSWLMADGSWHMDPWTLCHQRSAMVCFCNATVWSSLETESRSIARALRLSQPLEQRLGLLEREARVGDALAVDRRLTGHVILPPLDEVAFDHRAEDLPRARRDLIADRGGDVGLAMMIFVAVAVRA